MHAHSVGPRPPGATMQAGILWEEEGEGGAGKGRWSMGLICRPATHLSHGAR